jgi:hypothetical protein
MAMMFLFQSDVTLNGDPSPTILEKLAFVLVFIVAGWISYYIMFSRTHHSLKRHLEKELELKKPHTTKPRAN